MRCLRSSSAHSSRFDFARLCVPANTRIAANEHQEERGQRQARDGAHTDNHRRERLHQGQRNREVRGRLRDSTASAAGAHAPQRRCASNRGGGIRVAAVATRWKYPRHLRASGAPRGVSVEWRGVHTTQRSRDVRAGPEFSRGGGVPSFTFNSFSARFSLPTFSSSIVRFS